MPYACPFSKKIPCMRGKRCNFAPQSGLVAEWLGKALQKLVQRFESARDLNTFLKDAIWRPFLFLC
jgi:hypothetical protein